MIIIVIVTVIVVAATLEVAAWALIRSLSHIPTREFPPISDALIARFTSFDPELGHLPVAGSVSFDRDVSGKAYANRCSYDTNQARTSSFGADAPAFASSFGDSFCQCRGVADEETWQRQLEIRLGGPVRNYGVGGHGLDQAYLRYLRIRAEPLGPVIIFAVSPCTIERIVGIYKHYIEFGNVLGLKPRFRLGSQDVLEKIDIPIRNVNEIKIISSHRDYLHQHDENYKGFFKLYSARFPFMSYYFGNCLHLEQALISVALPLVPQRTAMHTWLEARDARTTETARQQAYRRKNAYFATLYKAHERLFVEIVREITVACKEDGRRAILLLLPDYTNIGFSQEHGHFYCAACDRAAHETGIEFVDSFETFARSDPKRTFLKDNSSGHHTALGNAMVADLLRERLVGQNNNEGAETRHNR